MIHPRFAQNFAFHPPWGDCREIGLIRPNDPQVRPLPPPNAHETSLCTPETYPDELDKGHAMLSSEPRRLKRKRLKKKKIVAFSEMM
jgi:hypothetical protein